MIVEHNPSLYQLTFDGFYPFTFYQTASHSPTNQYSPERKAIDYKTQNNFYAQPQDLTQPFLEDHAKLIEFDCDPEMNKSFFQDKFIHQEKANFENYSNKMSHKIMSQYQSQQILQESLSIIKFTKVLLNKYESFQQLFLNRINSYQNLEENDVSSFLSQPRLLFQMMQKLTTNQQNFVNSLKMEQTCRKKIEKLKHNYQTEKAKYLKQEQSSMRSNAQLIKKFKGMQKRTKMIKNVQKQFDMKKTKAK